MLSRFAQAKWRWAVLGLALVVVAAAFGAIALTRGEQASADQLPPGCNTNGLTETLSVTPSGVVRDGAVLAYSVTFTNNAAGACNVTGLNASLVKPDLSSTPLLTNVNFNAGDAPITCPGDARCATPGPYQYTVALANEVGSASGCPPTTTPPPAIGSGPRLVVGYAQASGTLHISTEDIPGSAADCKVVQNVVTHPQTTLTKTASPTNGRAPLAVTYTYNETNNGDSPISGVSLSDDTCSPVAFQSGDTNSNGILNPGETWVFTCNKTFNTAGTFTNHVTATGTATADGLPAPPETAQATVTVRNPQTTLTKTASPSNGRAPLAVTYTYNETNNGTDPISGVSLSDDLCSPVTGPTSGDTNSNGILDPGETWVFTCNKTFNTAGTFTNHVTATGTDTADSQPAPPETAQATVTVRNPHTTLTKTASPSSGRAPLAVTYTYNETNNGTDPISGVSLSDDLCSPVTGPTSGDTNSNGILDPGETWVFTCNKTFTTAGTFTNHVTATGTDTADSQPAPPETAQATVTVRNPHTTLTKTASPSSGRAPLAVTYTYNETNNGTDPISGVSLSDDLCSPVTGPTSGDTNSNGILDPGETWVFTCNKTFTTAGTFTNHVTATGTDTADSQPAPPETAQATVTVRNPQTTLTKTASPSNGRAPLAVTYTYNETNNGTDPISGVSLSDDLCSPVTGPTSGDTNSNGILDPGETWVFTCNKTFNTAGTFTNHVTATGTDTADSQPAPPETAQATVTVTNPHTTLTKTASPTSGSVPLAVTYTYNETNDGTDPISGVSLSDDTCSPVTGPTSGDTNSNGILDPGETWVFTCSKTFTTAGTFTNHVTATGTDTVDGLPAPVETAQATVSVTGGQGCTPGFWKNHTDATKYPNAWPPTGYSPSQLVSSVFTVPSGYASFLGSSTLAQALAFQGGNTLDGAAQILLRAAVSAVLNAAHPGIGYPLTVGEIVTQVNAALASKDRGTILTLATTLDNDNNLGCPISGK